MSNPSYVFPSDRKYSKYKRQRKERTSCPLSEKSLRGRVNTPLLGRDAVKWKYVPGYFRKFIPVTGLPSYGTNYYSRHCNQQASTDSVS